MKASELIERLQKLIEKNGDKDKEEERPTGFAGTALGVTSHGFIEMLVMREMRRQFDLDGSSCPCCCCRRRKDNESK